MQIAENLIVARILLKRSITIRFDEFYVVVAICTWCLRVRYIKDPSVRWRGGEEKKRVGKTKSREANIRYRPVI